MASAATATEVRVQNIGLTGQLRQGKVHRRRICRRAESGYKYKRWYSQKSDFLSRAEARVYPRRRSSQAAFEDIARAPSVSQP